MALEACCFELQPPSYTVLQERSITKSFLAGSFSGACSCLLFQPLDLIKTRVQAPAVFGSNGMISTIYTVVRTDSIKGLWRGVTPTISRTVPGVGIYFCALHFLKSFLFVSREPTAVQNVLLGFSARSAAGISLLPITVVKTRYESGIFNYRGVVSALVSIWKSEGLKGLFSGFAATIARDAPFSGLYLMFYNKAKEIANHGFGEVKYKANIHFVCGVSAGILASVATQPADVVKTQMQLYPFRYKNTVDCVFVVVKNNGLLGLYRGTLPRCIRRTLMAALTWTVYESVMQKCGLKV